MQGEGNIPPPPPKASASEPNVWRNLAEGRSASGSSLPGGDTVRDVSRTTSSGNTILIVPKGGYTPTHLELTEVKREEVNASSAASAAVPMEGVVDASSDNRPGSSSDAPPPKKARPCCARRSKGWTSESFVA